MVHRASEDITDISCAFHSKPICLCGKTTNIYLADISMESFPLGQLVYCPVLFHTSSQVGMGSVS